MNVLVLCGDRWHPVEIIKRGLSFVKGHTLTFVEDAKDSLTPDALTAYQVIINCKSDNLTQANDAPWFEKGVTEVGPEELRQYIALKEGREENLRTFNVNTLGLLRVTEAFLPMMGAGIKRLHDVQEGRELVAALVVAVHMVGNGNKTNPMLTEKHLGVKVCLQIITTDAAHVLYKNTGNLAGLDIRNQLFPSKSLKIASAPTVVRIVDTVAEAILRGVAFEVGLLVQNGVRLSRKLVVAG